jgi:hypothetical protein
MAVFEWAAIKNGVYGRLFEYFCSTKVTRRFVRRLRTGRVEREALEGELPVLGEADGRQFGNDRWNWQFGPIREF